MIFKPKSVTVSVTGDLTKELYRGEFSFKTMLSHSDRFSIARKQKELLGSNKLDDLPVVLQQKAVILSELSVRVVGAPQWWSPDDLIDDNLIVKIFEEAVDAENEQVKKLLGDGDKAKKDLEAIVENASKSDVIDKKV